MQYGGYLASPDKEYLDNLKYDFDKLGRYVSDFLLKSRTYNKYLKYDSDRMESMTNGFSKAFTERNCADIRKYTIDICQTLLLESDSKIAERLCVSEEDAKMHRAEFMATALPVRLITMDG